MKIVVTSTSHASLFRAFFELELDNGGVNRIEGTPVAFTIPESMSLLVDKADRALSELSQEDLETFVCGEETEALHIKERQGNLEEAYALLDALFDGQVARKRTFQQEDR